MTAPAQNLNQARTAWGIREGDEILFADLATPQVAGYLAGVAAGIGLDVEVVTREVTDWRVA